MKKNFLKVVLLISFLGNVKGQTNFWLEGTWKSIPGADTITFVFKKEQITLGTHT